MKWTVSYTTFWGIRSVFNWVNVVGYCTLKLLVRGKHSGMGRSKLITSETLPGTERTATLEKQLEQFVNFLATKPEF